MDKTGMVVRIRTKKPPKTRIGMKKRKQEQGREKDGDVREEGRQNQ